MTVRVWSSLTDSNVETHPDCNSNNGMKVALTYYKAPHSTSVPCLLAPSYKGIRELLVAEANEVLSEE